MALRHVVLFELKPDKASQEGVELLAGELRALEGRIDFVSNVTVGPDISRRSAFSLVFTCDLPDKGYLQSYIDHPAHVSIVDDHVRPSCEQWVVVDYEV